MTVSQGLTGDIRLLPLRLRGIADVYDATLAIGEAAGAAAAPALVEQLRGRLRRVAAKARTAGIGEGPRPRTPRVAVIRLDAEGWEPVSSPWASELVAMLGGVCPVSSVGGLQDQDQPQGTWTRVRAFAPDVLLLVAEQAAETALDRTSELASLPGWWALPAVFRGDVFLLSSMSSDLVLRPGIHVADAAALLAHLLRGGESGGKDLQEAAVKRQSVLKLDLMGGGRCRPRNLPNYFVRFL